LGKIELFLQDDGNYTGNFQANAGVNIDKIYSSLAQPDLLYSVRSGDIFSSNEVNFNTILYLLFFYFKACLMLLAGKYNFLGTK
jgi:hypothetical protein